MTLFGTTVGNSVKNVTVDSRRVCGGLDIISNLKDKIHKKNQKRKCTTPLVPTVPRVYNVPMTTNELAEAVQRHAVVNYEKSGWDYIVECWDREAIRIELERCGITTVEDAIAEFGKFADVWDDRRKDIQAEIF